MSSSLAGLSDELRGAADDFVRELARAGLQPRVTSARRSATEQMRLFRRFLQGLSAYPALPPGSSAHEQGWAFDLVLDAYGEFRGTYEAMVDSGAAALWRSWGGAWGGKRDPIHFELPGASGEAKRLATTPGTREFDLLGGAVDFALGFLPVVGEVEMFATVLGYFPAFKESELLQFLSGPVEYIRRQ